MFCQMSWMKQNKVHPEPFRWVILMACLAGLVYAIYETVLR
jgi:hypothetical protein